jgi:hypothetical protein
MSLMKRSLKRFMIYSVLILVIVGVIFIGGYVQTPPSGPDTLQQPPRQTNLTLQPFLTQTVEISLKIPKTTPDNADIIFAALSFTNEPWVQVTLERDGDRATGAVQLPTNTFLYYTYTLVLGGEEGVRSESIGPESFDPFRVVKVHPDLTKIEDTVSGWKQLKLYDGPVNLLQGRVTDNDGTPIFNVLVVAGGVKTYTGYDGTYSLYLPPGKHLVTFFTELHDFKSQSKQADLSTDQSLNLDVQLEKAEKVTVVFTVETAEELPDKLRIVGNTYKLGTFMSQGPISYMERAPILTTRDDKTFTTTLEFYGGQYLEYVYTFGGVHLSAEPASDGSGIQVRRFIVTPTTTQINDHLNSFREYSKITFNLRTPPETHPKENILFENIPMHKVGENQYQLEIFVKPGYVIEYNYAHGIPGEGCEIIDPTPQERRRIVVGTVDQVVNDVVEKWPFSDYGERTTAINTNVSIAPRSEFAVGHNTFDWWAPNFLTNFDGLTDDLVRERHDYVGISMITDYLRVEPEPRFQFWFTPMEDLKEAVEIAHGKGLKVIVFQVIGFSYEYQQFFDEHVNTGISAEWYNAWFDQMELFFIGFAKVAEEAGIEVIQIPSPPPCVTDQYIDLIDERMNQLITETRKVYSGKLYSPVHWGTRMTYFSNLDLLDPGFSQVDLGVPSNASVEEMKAAFDSLFDTQVKQIYDHYNVPIAMWFTYNTIEGAASGKSVTEPYLVVKKSEDYTVDLSEHERLANAFMQSVAERGYIELVLGRDYSYIHLPSDPGPGFRSKPAAEVWGEYNELIKQAIQR